MYTSTASQKVLKNWFCVKQNFVLRVFVLKRFYCILCPKPHIKGSKGDQRAGCDGVEYIAYCAVLTFSLSDIVSSNIREDIFSKEMVVLIPI